uniref:N-acetylmuramoyl-L-alanine amidase n=1 Tax=Paraconexibacter sp. TaxID=2949640 RepID=UPI0035628377
MPHHLTRRRLLATGALAGAAAFVPSGGGITSAWAARRRRPQSFSMDVPGSAFRGGRQTGVLRAPRRFDLLGVRGAGVRGAGLEVRARPRGGRWSRWAPLDVARHGPDDRGPLAASEPVWVGDADELQLRARRPLGGVRVAFVAVPADARSAATARAATASARASQAGGAPPIIGRDVWEAGRCPPRTGPSYGQVQMAFVHHTVSANDYTARDSAGIVLSICKYHRDSNGWNDIGYNFIVDRFGQIFEGRAGGVDQAVIGAQAEGYNRFSTGVANLGTFSSVPQSDAAIDALGRLIGWKLAVHGAPATGTVQVTSGGGKTNRYPSGRLVTFERISGHRDGCSTECPGNALYAQLPAIRARAAGVSPAVAAVARLSIRAAETAVPYAQPAAFSGQLTGADGNPVGGVRINLQKRGSSGRFTTIARTTTERDGSFEVEAPWRATGVVRVTARPAEGAASVRSPRVSVKMTRALTAEAATTRIQAGRTIAISGRVRPRAGVRVRVERDAGGGRYVRVADVPVKVKGTRFAARLRLRKAGLYRLTAYTSKRAGSVEAEPLFVRAVRDIRKTPAPGSSGGTTPASGGAPSSGGVAASTG